MKRYQIPSAYDCDNCVELRSFDEEYNDLAKIETLAHKTYVLASKAFNNLISNLKKDYLTIIDSDICLNLSENGSSFILGDPKSFHNKNKQILSKEETNQIKILFSVWKNKISMHGIVLNYFKHIIALDMFKQLANKYPENKKNYSENYIVCGIKFDKQGTQFCSYYDYTINGRKYLFDLKFDQALGMSWNFNQIIGLENNNNFFRKEI